MLNFGLSMGRTGLGVKPPLLQGNYIWYSLDPETGYIVDANRVNYVKDEGNIGTFDGKLHSGYGLALDTSAYIQVPINYDGSVSVGAVCYFDLNTGRFVQVTNLPLDDVYKITGVSVGSIVRLYTNVFSADDIVKIEAEPNILYKWAKGFQTELSIPKAVEDKFYLNDEQSGRQLYEINYTTPLSVHTVDINIPKYDASNPEHLLINEANGNWTTENLNNPDYKHFYIEPGVYHTLIYATVSGTVDEPRTISLYGSDLHPASVSTNNQASIYLHFNGCSDWVLDRISSIDCIADDVPFGTPFRAIDSDRIVFNKPYAENFPTFFIVGRNTNDTVVQQGYFNGMELEALKSDNVAWEINTAEASVNLGNKCLDCDFVNCNDAMQLVRGAELEDDLDFGGTIMDGNRAWTDGRVWTDGTYGMPQLSVVAEPYDKVPYKVSFSGSTITSAYDTDFSQATGTITIKGTANNDGNYTVVSTDQMTITVAETFTDEADVLYCEIMTQEPNPNYQQFVSDGDFMFGENAIDFKVGTPNANNKVELINNIFWYFKDRDVTAEGVTFTQGSGRSMPIHYGTKNILVDNNIFYYGGEFLCVSGTKSDSGYSLKDSDITNNLFIDGKINARFDDAGNGNYFYSTQPTINVNSNSFVRQNDKFIDYTVDTYGVNFDYNVVTRSSSSDSDINDTSSSYNYYYDAISNLSDTDTRVEFPNESDAKLLDYIFEYRRYTTTQSTMILNDCITSKNSPHYGIAGNNTFTVRDDILLFSGTFSRIIRSSYGIQKARIDTNSEPINTNLIRCNEDTVISTGVAIDGSQTDFTMMLGFTLPEDTEVGQYLASSSGDNRVFMYHSRTDDLNILSVGVGRYNQAVTFDETKPIHAMVAVYNHTTSQLQVAIDGEPLSAPFDIVFDGPTSPIYLGASSTSGGEPFKGYLSEGVLSATMESEDAWFTFWERVQLARCDKPDGEFLDNWTFDCGTAGWGFDSAYPATITDNGDGSLHLKTNSNFGSLVPNNETFEADDWVIEVKFRNQVGNGKISFRRPNGTWVSTPTIGDGVHQSDPFSGAIAEIHVGADGDDTYEADYEYISLKRRVVEVLTTDSGEPLTTDNGEEITI